MNSRISRISNHRTSHLTLTGTCLQIKIRSWPWNKSNPFRNRNRLSCQTKKYLIYQKMRRRRKKKKQVSIGSKFNKASRTSRRSRLNINKRPNCSESSRIQAKIKKKILITTHKFCNNRLCNSISLICSRIK